MTDLFKTLTEYIIPFNCAILSGTGIILGMQYLYRQQYKEGFHEGYQKGQAEKEEELKKFFENEKIIFVQRDPHKREDNRFYSLDDLLKKNTE